jgi:hypothetical protein
LADDLLPQNCFEGGEKYVSDARRDFDWSLAAGVQAFHVNTGFIHIAPVVGLLLLVLHFLRGGRAAA